MKACLASGKPGGVVQLISTMRVHGNGQFQKIPSKILFGVRVSQIMAEVEKTSFVSSPHQRKIIIMEMIAAEA